MARKSAKDDFSDILDSARYWINTCLVSDGSLFGAEPLWTPKLCETVYRAFADNPDVGSDSFMTKLTGQMRPVGPAGQKLMAEALWALLLFPSNIKPLTKRTQIASLWTMSGEPLDLHHPLLADRSLRGIGSGGTGFNNHRPREVEFLLGLMVEVKRLNTAARRHAFEDYEAFMELVASAPPVGNRQYRHMLRYFAFPDVVERMSSNNDRRRVLDAFEHTPSRITRNWSDRQFDDAMLELRRALESEHLGQSLDFYDPPLDEVWKMDDEEGGADEGSGQGRSFDRTSAIVARKAIESIWPDPAPRKAALDVFVRGIRHAHGLDEGAWSVTLHPSVLRLTVGGIVAVDLRRRGLYLLVDQPSLGQALAESLARFESEEPSRYLEGARAYLVPFTEVEPAASQLETACMRLIERAIEKSSKAPSQDSHSPGVVRYLRELGYDVPSPSHESKATRVSEGEGAAYESESPITLGEISEQTGVPVPTLERWLQAVNRKGQAILYGPPGTGKTFMARRLAQLLTSGQSGGGGHVELLQFHPAYAYEDFIQGLRPQLSPSGQLRYELVPGRFMRFCEEAERRSGVSVLIIDEINRANLAQVFGELMYLLEYRDDRVPLAGGNVLQIPAKVRIIGTMNTADRSIALVDHALRRRFAFIPLRPDYDILLRYHRDRGFDAAGLVATLEQVNREIADEHYAIGISYFMRPDLADHIEPIWRGEIEPYIEELFFDRRSTTDKFRWDRIGDQASLTAADA